MDTKEILSKIGEQAAAMLKADAAIFIKQISPDDIRDAVTAKVQPLIDTLEAERQSSDSPWVKIRNWLEIQYIQSRIDGIVKAVQDGLNELTAKNAPQQ